MLSRKTNDVEQLLDKARKELLDLSLRNPMLNFKLSKAKGVEVIEAKSKDIFNLLVEENKPLSFLFSDEKEVDEQKENNGYNNIEKSTENEKPLKSSQTVNKTQLKTPYNEKTLHSRLLKTYYDARTFIEDTILKDKKKLKRRKKRRIKGFTRK